MVGGWPVAYCIWNLVWWIALYLRTKRIEQFADAKKQYYINRHIYKKYFDIVEKYSSLEESSQECNDFKIWFFWGQGKENMPLLVKACYEKIKENNPNVVFLDMNNVREFVQIPEKVYEKLHNKELLFAHFSDILRNTLLAQYGGLWIDSTVWFPHEIPEVAKTQTFFSPHNEKDNTYWCSYAMGCNKTNSVTFSFVRDILTTVCIKEKVWPDYLFQDRVIKFAHNYIPAAKQSINATSTNNCSRYMLFALMNKPFNEKQYIELTNKNFLFKLSYKATYKTEHENQETYYKRLILGERQEKQAPKAIIAK
jgi:hypothetical protein